MERNIKENFFENENICELSVNWRVISFIINKLFEKCDSIDNLMQSLLYVRNLQ